MLSLCLILLFTVGFSMIGVSCQKDRDDAGSYAGLVALYLSFRPAESTWGGLTIDEPYRTDRIELAAAVDAAGYHLEFFRNPAYTCGRFGQHTFVLAEPLGVTRDIVRPLWVRMHGGGVGAYTPAHSYSPADMEGWLDEEDFSTLGGILDESGLIANVRAHTAGFRFLIPSMCDHDLYSGVGVPEPNNPHSPDENGMMRAADGLLASKAALAYTRNLVATSQVFLHGTSAGSIGAFSVAYTLEREGVELSGVIMDSHVLNEDFESLAASCGLPYDSDLIRAKVGPVTESNFMPERVVGRGEISVPILHLWSTGDPSCCGQTPYTFLDDQGVAQTMGSCDYHHEKFRSAIESNPPGGNSENLRMCVNDPATSAGGACDMHSPTKIVFDLPVPPGDQLQSGLDYNAYIIGWVEPLLSP